MTGTVSFQPAPHPLQGERPTRNRSLVCTDDPELGPQVVDVYGDLPLGQPASVLCLTPIRRCESADVIHERLSLWPLTPLVLTGAVELALAASLLYVRIRAQRNTLGRRFNG